MDIKSKILNFFLSIIIFKSFLLKYKYNKDDIIKNINKPLKDILFIYPITSEF